MPDLKTEIQFIKGVGPRRADDFAKAGIRTVEDALYRIPFRYEDRSRFASVISVRPGETVTLSGRITGSALRKTGRRGFTVFEALLDDGTASIKAIWFNQPFLAKTLKKDSRAILFGKITVNRFGKASLQLENSEYEMVKENEDPVHTAGIVPVYRNIQGIGQKTLRKTIHTIVKNLEMKEADFLPNSVVNKFNLTPREKALKDVHFPETGTNLDLLNAGASEAHRRLIFEEFFLLQTGLLHRKSRVSEKKGISFRTTGDMGGYLRKVLPFKLTNAQRRVFREIVGDMTSGKPMRRLLQGDVGSGKTIVALLAMLIAVKNGYQAALMAPTEILAEQHFRTISDLLKDGDCGISLLRGGQPKKEREIAEKNILDGKTDIVIGTHALIEKKISFRNLGIAVIDEQHRFGVEQRAEMAEKAAAPDVLVMTATPIPRSLALTVYGDLDLSVIDCLPPGRTPVLTKVVFENKRNELYAYIRKNLGKGGQCFVVYPLIEESDKLEMKAATEMYSNLKRIFSEFTVGLIHGRMKSAEKEEVMMAFQRNEINMLVSTTVIEVGIDIPNSNIMVVENAERFGLAQLHQLRGRVGRGLRKSCCILAGGRKISADAMERLRIMEATNDGFVIAEKDLEMRGPGDFFGKRQSGLPVLRIGNIVRDREIMELARNEAAEYLKDIEEGKISSSDPAMRKVKEVWQNRFGLLEIG